MTKKQKSKVDPPMYAFWEYSSMNDIRGFIGSKFEELREDGGIYSVSYQRWFKPAAITSEETGHLVMSELEDLQKQYDTERNELRKQYLAKRDEIFKIHKIDL